MVKLLLRYGADITLQNDQGETALEVAPDEMRKLILGRKGKMGGACVGGA